MNTTLSRRDALKTLAGATASLALTGCQSLPIASSGDLRPKRVLRIAHMTDFHVQPELAAGQGMAAALHHVQSQPDKPDLIFNTGDCVMDACAADRARTRIQWDVFQKALRAENSLPVEHCIGNHDIWGWNPAAGAQKSDPQYGKKWACDELGLGKTYRSFDRGGWHFVVLDTIQPDGPAFRGGLDEEQFQWLKADLAATPATTPVVLFSHMPILSVAAYFDMTDSEITGDWMVKHFLVAMDARRLKDLFYSHGNVKLCISGHLHMVDRVDYLGTSHITGLAVCGNWWKGMHQEFDAGYGMLDLYEDGTFKHENVTYGWVAKT